jgi:hypothetical protein
MLFAQRAAICGKPVMLEGLPDTLHEPVSKMLTDSNEASSCLLGRTWAQITADITQLLHRIPSWGRYTVALVPRHSGRDPPSSPLSIGVAQIVVGPAELKAAARAVLMRRATVGRSRWVWEIRVPADRTCVEHVLNHLPQPRDHRPSQGNGDPSNRNWSACRTTSWSHRH